VFVNIKTLIVFILIKVLFITVRLYSWYDSGVSSQTSQLCAVTVRSS